MAFIVLDLFAIGANRQKAFQFTHLMPLPVELLSNPRQAERNDDEREQTHPGVPQWDRPPRINVAGQRIYGEPSGRGEHRHPNTGSPARKPCGSTHREKIKPEKADFVSGQIIQPASDQRANDCA